MKEKSLTDLLQKYGLEFTGLHYSSYRGIVIDNNDPDRLGKVLVNIPSIHGGTKVWAKSKSQIGGNGWGAKFMAPLIGDVVWVEFENGNIFKALWSYHGWAKSELPADLDKTTSLGLITPSGNKVILDDENGKLTIRVGKMDEHEDETTIVIDNGTTTINGGKLKGLVNIDPLRSLINAIQQDLIVAQSGTQVSKWMADPNGLAALEDTKFNH